jgi:hypothetical protein
MANVRLPSSQKTMFEFLPTIKKETPTTTEDDDEDSTEDDDEIHNPTVAPITDHRVRAYIRALNVSGKADQRINIRDCARHLGALEERHVRFSEIVTEERKVRTWNRMASSTKRQLNKDQCMAMESVEDMKAATKHLSTSGFEKMGENMVRDIFESLFSEYTTHLEVIGASEWIDVKMVLEIGGVRYEYLVEVKTSRITRANAVVPAVFRKDPDVSRDESREPLVWSGNVAQYDCLNHLMSDVDYYRLQRKEGAILVNLIVHDGSTKRQMQNARKPDCARWLHETPNAECA